MELHYRVVSLSTQTKFEGTYHHIIAYNLLLYMFGVVLAVF